MGAFTCWHPLWCSTGSFWSLPPLSRVMGMIAQSREQLLQLWISNPAVLSGFPQPRGDLMALFSCCFASGSGELTGLGQKLWVTGRISSRARISGLQPADCVLWGSWRRGSFGALVLLCLAKAVRPKNKAWFPSVGSSVETR